MPLPKCLICLFSRVCCCLFYRGAILPLNRSFCSHRTSVLSSTKMSLYDVYLWCFCQFSQSGWLGNIDNQKSSQFKIVIHARCCPCSSLLLPSHTRSREWDGHLSGPVLLHSDNQSTTIEWISIISIFNYWKFVEKKAQPLLNSPFSLIAAFCKHALPWFPLSLPTVVNLNCKENSSSEKKAVNIETDTWSSLRS